MIDRHCSESQFLLRHAKARHAVCFSSTRRRGSAPLRRRLSVCSSACGWRVPCTGRATLSADAVTASGACHALCISRVRPQHKRYEHTESLRPSQQRSRAASGGRQPVRAWRAPSAAVASLSSLFVFPSLGVLRLGAVSALHFRPHYPLRLMVRRAASGAI